MIPNNKLSQAIVINYNLPTETQYLLLTFGVHHNTDPQIVEDVLLKMVHNFGYASPEEAFKADESPDKIRGLLFHPEPIVRFREFGEFTLNFRFFVAVSHFDLQFEARSNVMKQVYYAFKKAGIVVPMPVRALQIGSTPDPSGQPSVSAAEIQSLLKEIRERK